MRFQETPLAGSWLVGLDRQSDERGSFARTFCENEFAAHGLPVRFPQCNLSSNVTTGTLRGMHFNRAPHGESKLVRCVRGAVHDVIVDLRPESVTRFQWFGVDLCADNGLAIFIPAGFAHGFVTLAPHTDVHYHMGSAFRGDAADGIRWDDPAIGIRWPTDVRVLSDRDASFADLDPQRFDRSR